LQSAKKNIDFLFLLFTKINMCITPIYRTEKRLDKEICAKCCAATSAGNGRTTSARSGTTIQVKLEKIS